MWNAKIFSNSFVKGQLLIGVEYSNGVQTFNETIDLTGGTKEGLDARIQAKLLTLNTSDIAAAAIAIGDFTVKPLPQANKDLNQYFEDRNTLNKLQSLVSAGILDPADIVDLQVKLKAEFKPEYL